jgi:hypothetical protein
LDPNFTGIQSLAFCIVNDVTPLDQVPESVMHLLEPTLRAESPNKLGVALRLMQAAQKSRVHAPHNPAALGLGDNKGPVVCAADNLEIRSYPVGPRRGHIVTH